MTINAVLRRLVISSAQPEQMATFYRDAFDYEFVAAAAEIRCEAINRSVWIRPGTSNQLLESVFTMDSDQAVERYSSDLRSRGVEHSFAAEHGPAVQVRDPDGRSLCFAAREPGDSLASGGGGSAPPARLQHYAVRTPSPQRLLDFYSNALAFTVSDLVRDKDGDLTAAFLRTDAEHHALAIFRAPQSRLDHFSCETRDWDALRDWADHMAERSVQLVWGVGRHGPGNDTFFMVHDPDGNLVEISSDLEICSEERPAGIWEHRMETLNRWGIAIMRS
jgi:catechol 2,3-dioxygenase-like lactoylglutathione lyase family enzyme